MRAQSLVEQTPPGRETVRFQYISEIPSTDDRSALLQILGEGRLGVRDHVNVCFSDGSVIRKFGRCFSSCSVYLGENDPLNTALSLPQVSSSFMSETHGCKGKYMHYIILSLGRGDTFIIRRRHSYMFSGEGCGGGTPTKKRLLNVAIPKEGVDFLSDTGFSYHNLNTGG